MYTNNQQATVAEVLAARLPGNGATCTCGWVGNRRDAFEEGSSIPEQLRAHQAATVLEALATATPARLSDEERAQIVAASLVDQTVGRNWHRTLTAVEAILAARAVQPTPPETPQGGGGSGD